MPLLSTVLWNKTEGRLRAGWRVGLQFGVWIYLPVLINRWLTPRLVEGLERIYPGLAPLWEQTVPFLIAAISVFVGTWLVVHYVDRRPFVDLGFKIERAWWEDLLFGVVLGALLMSMIFLVEQLLGWIQVQQLLANPSATLSFWTAILIPLVAFIVISLTEELLSSGYQVRNLAEGLNQPWLGPELAILVAWGAASIVFAWLHTTNPNSSLASTMNLFLLGLFFGFGYVLTGSLAIPIGLHFSWNFFQGTVFGFPVSGRVYGEISLLTIEQSGPSLWTGGAFGPEAGLMGLVAILVGAALTAWWVRLRSGSLHLHLPLARYRPLSHRAPIPDFNLSHTQE